MNLARKLTQRKKKNEEKVEKGEFVFELPKDRPQKPSRSLPRADFKDDYASPLTPKNDPKK